MFLFILIETQGYGVSIHDTISVHAQKKKRNSTSIDVLHLKVTVMPKQGGLKTSHQIYHIGHISET